MHEDAIEPGARVLIVDDVIATGGTALAAAELVKQAGGEPVGFGFFIELAFLEGRRRLAPLPIRTVVTY
jgi:adenine phosphoribosyltransferase